MDAITTIQSQHPRADELSPRTGALIAELLECAAVCSICADACANEPDLDLGRCVRLDVDCATVCRATAELLTRQPLVDPGQLARMLSTCAGWCERCADECRTHAEHHAHCATCAEVCSRCADHCAGLAGALRTDAQS